MVTIENIHLSKSVLSSSGVNDKSFVNHALVSNHLGMERKQRKKGSTPMTEYLDMPGLVSDDENLSDDEISSEKSLPGSGSDTKKNEVHELSAAGADVRTTDPTEALTQEVKDVEDSTELSAEQFKHERDQLMSVIIRYVSAKITNSFPPESPSELTSSELPLETFILILVSRLHLSLPMFMKGVIYLFRYMDIIYLLRYLNQSNNFANYNGMDFTLKKLIVGCFNLALTRERSPRNWAQVTGLSNTEVNAVVRTIVSRLNGKLGIKPIELLKLKSEIFRYVKMVTKTI